jgi:M3 family oligoendopeptidase
MKFSEYKYTRPNLKKSIAKYEEYLQLFEQAVGFEEQSSVMQKINLLGNKIQSMASISYVRHTIDTKDAFYEKENDFFDQNGPSLEEVGTKYNNLLINSKFRPELEAKWGKQLFVLAELSAKTFVPTILELLQEENKLSSEYVKFKAAAQLEFRGKTYNLSSINPFETDPDRDTRKESAETKWAYFAEHAEKVEGIFDQLVKVRHKIALELGYKNFVELAYIRMKRSDYDAKMVARFRKQVEDFIVPISTKLYERQSRRIGVDKLKYYDEDYRFASGNPRPKGAPDFILEGAKKMYAELSPDTDAFFKFMVENDLMDLVNKDGKASGGYCTHIAAHKAPFIFSNFNGTSGDIDVLTHEAGHAFQYFSSRNKKTPEYYWPTYEACEIHSMSMEFFTWPWMHLFFKDDVNKYHFAHLSGALQFLPYGVAVDEFQHFVYEHPEVGPAERNAAWKSIEQKYLPGRDYDGNAFLEGGGFWQKQNHIFNSPFYYIDYTLAQICAFQFWKKDRENHTQAWKDYVRLCKAGGSQSFLSLVELAGLRSPFDGGCVSSVVGEITDWLDGIDDSGF